MDSLRTCPSCGTKHSRCYSIGGTRLSHWLQAALGGLEISDFTLKMEQVSTMQ